MLLDVVDRLGQLVARLMNDSAEFKAWWTEQSSVGSVAEFEKVMMHPFAGELRMIETVFTVNDNPGQRVLLFLPQDEETKEKMQQLYEARLAEQAGGTVFEDQPEERLSTTAVV